MAEKPIIICQQLIPPTLDGRKNVTRRIIDLSQDIEWVFEGIESNGQYRFAHYNEEGLIDGLCFRKPRYQKGDLLWVKETHCECPKCGIVYKADNQIHNTKWKSARFMFKKYARIWLEVLDVRPERLQEITSMDITKEGIDDGLGNRCPDIARHNYKALWDSLNAKRGYSWESNPWVFRYIFKRIKP